MGAKRMGGGNAPNDAPSRKFLDAGHQGLKRVRGAPGPKNQSGHVTSALWCGKLIFLPLLVLSHWGAVPVKISTGDTIFLENTREFPEFITSTGAKFW